MVANEKDLESAHETEALSDEELSRKWFSARAVEHFKYKYRESTFDLDLPQGDETPFDPDGERHE